MSADINASELNNWKVLNHLTEELLDDVIFVHIYGYERKKDQGLSALFIKKNHEVFITGFPSLVDGPYNSLMPKDSATRLDGVYYKLKELSKLGLKKIVVGFNFGAALNKNGDLYSWGDLSPAKFKIDDSAIVMFERYVSKVECSKCFEGGYYAKDGYNVYYVEVLHGGAKMCKCPYCYAVPTYTTESRPSSGVDTYRFILWDDSRKLYCRYCKNPTSSTVVEAHNSKVFKAPQLTYCNICELLLEVDDVTSVLPKDPQKVKIGPLKITNIFCGLQFLILQTDSNDLIILGSISNSHVEWTIYNPSNVVVNSVSCGGHHLAVISDKGDVYTCGDGSQGQLGYEWESNMGYMTLRPVILEGAATKVCCGYSSTVCLMSDGRIMCFGELSLPGDLSSESSESNIIWKPSPIAVSESNKVQSPVRIIVSQRIIEVANPPFTNIFFAKTESSLMYTWGYRNKSPYPARLILNCSGFSDAMADFPFTFEKSDATKAAKYNGATNSTAVHKTNKSTTATEKQILGTESNTSGRFSEDALNYFSTSLF